jgi:hypothetical protein
MKTRVAVYIDGSNFYHKLKVLEFPDLIKFDYRGLARWLSGECEIFSVWVCKSMRVDRVC